VTPPAKGTHAGRLNIVTGRQLRAARILAGLTQKQLAQAVGVHERAERYWELKKNKVPISAPKSLRNVEQVLLANGVIVFASPTPGARLASRKLAVGRLIKKQRKMPSEIKKSYPTLPLVGKKER
jgi:transcriptional regulator with XRE-family HTH domain